MENLEEFAHPSESHFEAIGELINTWSMLSFFLSHSLCLLITESGEIHKGDITTAIITNGMAAKTSVGLLRTLVKKRFPDDSKAFSKLCDQILKEKIQRDVFAHAIWVQGKSPKTIKPYLFKTVGDLKMARGELSVEDINDHTKLIKNLMKLLIGFTYHWGLGPLPEASPEKLT